MKSITLWIGVVAMLSCFGCTVETTIDDGNGGGVICEQLSCGDVLVNGLDVEGDALCSPGADAAYSDIYDCACGAAGACGDACGGSLCSDLGETSDCGDCLNQFCMPEHDTCANN